MKLIFSFVRVDYLEVYAYI